MARVLELNCILTPATRDTILLVTVCALIAMAVLTMFPWSGTNPNDLGYASICPFAPWSALTLLLVAGLTWGIRQYLKRPA